MGKKKSPHPPTKTPKQVDQNKPQIHNKLIKILRPKVFITGSSNFKNLVQQLTGNGASSSAPTRAVPTYDQDRSSFDSSCFSTPLEGSPESFMGAGCVDLEVLLMGLDSFSDTTTTYDSCYNSMMSQQEVCVYDYDLSSFM